MFLAAAPYFQRRFRTSQWILNHFQAAEVSVSTVTNLGSMVILTKLQKGASYPKRISASLFLYTAIFAVLAFSTLVKTGAGVYFGFLLVTMLLSSLATGLIQNGLFAFTSGYGRTEYTQAIMTGQGVAGVLPPLVQIISVAAVQNKKGDDADAAAESPKSAFIYFLTATAVSAISLIAFFYLLRRKAHSDALAAGSKSTVDGASEGDALTGQDGFGEPEQTGISDKPTVPLTTLFRKLAFLSIAVFLCFSVTMVFPVFTASVQSVSGIDSAVFIPLGFLLWNIGDLGGRLLTAVPKLSLTHFPFALFCIAMARLVFIPLYFLCNIKGRGAYVNSDIFYLVVVQFFFGLSNGYLGSSCMMGAGSWVAPEEREVAGGFMGMMLVAGLAVGSLLSFTLGDV
jgi:solute carrier family 29 (equilibrative nucleoside transporter), member 1/2/3